MRKMQKYPEKEIAVVEEMPKHAPLGPVQGSTEVSVSWTEVSVSLLSLPESLIHRQLLRRETFTGFPSKFIALTAKNNLKLWRMPRGQSKTPLHREC